MTKQQRVRLALPIPDSTLSHADADVHVMICATHHCLFLGFAIHACLLKAVKRCTTDTGGTHQLQRRMVLGMGEAFFANDAAEGVTEGC